jgi:hypothetical protein
MEPWMNSQFDLPGEMGKKANDTGKRPFPKKALAVGFIAIPLWFFFFVSRGVSWTAALYAEGVAFLLFTVTLVLVWQRANRGRR